MEIKVNLEVSFSPATLSALQNLFQSAPVKTEPRKAVEVKTDEEKPAKAAKAKPAKKDEAPEVELSTIRQWIAKKEANKAIARKALKAFDVEALTDLPKENYAEYYNTLVSSEDETNDLW